MQLLPAIVTYFPDNEHLKKYIAAFGSFVDRILISENTPAEEAVQYRFKNDHRVEYVSDGVNTISKTLNYLVGWAREVYRNEAVMFAFYIYEDFGDKGIESLAIPKLLYIYCPMPFSL